MASVQGRKLSMVPPPFCGTNPSLTPKNIVEEELSLGRSSVVLGCQVCPCSQAGLPCMSLLWRTCPRTQPLPASSSGSGAAAVLSQPHSPRSARHGGQGGLQAVHPNVLRGMWLVLALAAAAGPNTLSTHRPPGQGCGKLNGGWEREASLPSCSVQLNFLRT